MSFHCIKTGLQFGLAAIGLGFVGICNLSANAAETSPATVEWKEYPLAENGTLKAVLRVQTAATAADKDWLQIEVINSGKPTQILSAHYSLINISIENSGNLTPADRKRLEDSPLYSLVDDGPWRRRQMAIPQGIWNVPGSPGAQSAARLWFPDSPDGWRVRVEVKLDVILEDNGKTEGFSLSPAPGRKISTLNPVTFEFLWRRPDAAGMEKLRQRMVDYLNTPGQLNKGEFALLTTMLNDPELSRGVTGEQMLKALAQGQRLDDEEGKRRDLYSASGKIVQILNDRFAKDTQVLAHYRQALAAKDEAALKELKEAPKIWASDYVELVAGMVQPPTPLTREFYYTIVSAEHWAALEHAQVGTNSLVLLDMHYSSWAKDTALGPRLRNAYFGGEPHLEQYVLQSAEKEIPSSNENWVAAVRNLARTHDPAAVAWLRPYLSDKTVVMGSYLTQVMTVGFRACDMAHDAILHVINQPGEFGVFSYLNGVPPAEAINESDWKGLISHSFLESRGKPDSGQTVNPRDAKVTAMIKSLAEHDPATSGK